MALAKNEAVHWSANMVGPLSRISANTSRGASAASGGTPGRARPTRAETAQVRLAVIGRLGNRCSIQPSYGDVAAPYHPGCGRVIAASVELRRVRQECAVFHSS
jgi:hypothetical protein